MARADRVVTVPATPTHVRTPSTGTAANAPARISAVTARAFSTCSAVGGSSGRQRSVRRTQPMSTERAARTTGPSSVRSPTTTSVEPPPTSTTTNGPSSGSSSPTAPTNDSRASSSPEITSASAPRVRRTMVKKSSRFAASRVAEVATIRTRSTPLRSMIAV